MQVIVALIALGLVGLSLIVAGVHVMLGLGPCLVAAGMSVLLVCTFIRSGITPNG